jgi:perosamine synthetase
MGHPTRGKDKGVASQAQQPQKAIIAHSKPLLAAEDQKAIETVLKSGMVGEGDLVREFERAVSKYLGLTEGVATCSGTDALFLALKSLGIGDRDKVIIPTYVCRSVWNAVRATGAEAVLCDIGEDWCVNEDSVKRHMTRRTKAIVVVHTFGIMADVAPICKLGIPVIEDSCQALGARWDGRMAGTFGDFCVLSFHATKLLTTGEGGMVLANDKRWLSRLRNLKQEKEMRNVVHYRKPLSDLQAALGLSQLARYEDFLKRRRLIADYYFTHLRTLPVELPYHIRHRSIFFRFPLRIRGHFEALRLLFDEEGIQVRRGVDTLLHKMFAGDSDRYPVAQKYYAETLSIPLYPALKTKERRKVVEVCRRVIANEGIEGLGE